MKIEIPEGFEIDSFEKIDGAVVVTFKESKPQLPKSWEEFCKMFPNNFAVKRSDLMADDFIFLNSYHNRLLEDMEKFTGDRATAEAVLALTQLIQLRECYNQGWVPDWADCNVDKYVIEFDSGEIDAYIRKTVSTSPLYFKIKELRDEILKNFRPLIEKLKPLYGIKEGGDK